MLFSCIVKQIGLSFGPALLWSNTANESVNAQCHFPQTGMLSSKNTEKFNCSRRNLYKFCFTRKDGTLLFQQVWINSLTVFRSWKFQSLKRMALLLTDRKNRKHLKNLSPLHHETGNSACFCIWEQYLRAEIGHWGLKYFCKDWYSWGRSRKWVRTTNK